MIMITREIKVLETDFKCWFHHLLSNFNKLHNLSRPVFSLGKKSFKISIMSATWRRQWHPTPVLLHGKNPMDGGAWWATVHGVAQSQTQLSGFTFTFHFHALEKEMVTHSSVLAWRIPGTGETGGLSSMGSHRV